jgi:hypothetical protein
MDEKPLPVVASLNATDKFHTHLINSALHHQTTLFKPRYMVKPWVKAIGCFCKGERLYKGNQIPGGSLRMYPSPSVDQLEIIGRIVDSQVTK